LIEVRCFHLLKEVEALREQIDALNLKSARPDPFSTFEFYENYLRNEARFPRWKDFRPWFLCAFAGDELVGYLALKKIASKAFGMSAPQLDWLTAHVADRPHLVVKTELTKQVSEAFYAYLLKRKQEWSFLEFQQQDTTSPLFPAPSIDLKGFRVRQWPNMDNGNIVVRWSTLREYFRSLSKKFRSNLSRQMRTLFAAGKVEFLMSSDPAVTPFLLELYRIVEAHSWKSKTDSAIDRDLKWAAYYRALLDAGQPMRISIHLLLLDGMPIAGLINGSFEKRLYALHIVYDERMSRLAPGAAVLLMGVREAVNDRYECFDLLWGFEYYKSRWLAEITKTQSVQIYRVGGLFFWRRMLGDWKRRMLSGAKRELLLFNPARRDASEHEPEQKALNGKPTELNIDLRERERVAALIAELRKSRCERLSETELTAALPFETQRESGSRIAHSIYR
jgi:hypothetical protein